jgi:hypothetical protein
MRLRIVVLSVFAAAVLVAGCGGGGSSSSGGSTGGGSSSGSTAANTSEGTTSGSEEGKEGKPLTKAQYIKQGDAICGEIPKSYTQKLQALEKELKKKGQKPTKSEENLTAAVPPLYVAIEEFEQLTPPSGEEQKTEAIIAALENAAKGIEEKPESELSGPKSPFAEFQKLTKAYGLQFCSSL